MADNAARTIRLLSDNHYVLKTATFEWRRGNGEWQTQRRETYDRGNGAVLLPYVAVVMATSPFGTVSLLLPFTIDTVAPAREVPRRV